MKIWTIYILVYDLRRSETRRDTATPTRKEKVVRATSNSEICGTIFFSESRKSLSRNVLYRRSNKTVLKDTP